jgi:hypothetical protein
MGAVVKRGPNPGQCSEVFQYTINAAAITTASAASVAWVPLLSSELVKNINYNVGGEWTDSLTAHRAEMCFAPPDDVSGVFACSFSADVSHSTNTLYEVTLGISDSGSLSDGDEVQQTNWQTKNAVGRLSNFTTEFVQLVADGACVGLMGNEFVHTGLFTMYNYSLHCRQVNTANFPCHP